MLVFGSYGSEKHPVSNLSNLLYAQASSFCVCVSKFHFFLRFLVRLTMNPQFIMSDDLSPVFSPLFFRENMSMLMVTDLFPQNQQRSDIIGVLLYHLGV